MKLFCDADIDPEVYYHSGSCLYSMKIKPFGQFLEQKRNNTISEEGLKRHIRSCKHVGCTRSVMTTYKIRIRELQITPYTTSIEETTLFYLLKKICNLFRSK